MSRSVLGLGIETSCDETSVALVENGNRIVSLEIRSQIEEHARFHGVVPEIASRSHLVHINEVYERAMAGIDPASIDYVAVTTRPGLVGSLMIGGQFAKAFSLVHRCVPIPVDHVEAHLYAIALEREMPEYPFLGLMLSGGNSALFCVRGPGQIETIADTADDALGEAFDKVASLLALPYPGGPSVEARGSEYGDAPSSDRLIPKLLKSMPEQEMGFSFSGVKTAVSRALRSGADPARICHEFQDSVFELVERNLERGVKKTGIGRVVASGGVVANGVLRRRLDDFARRHRIELYYPGQKILCTDNGAMVAALGYRLFCDSRFADLRFTVYGQR